jgi:uncharacterized HAD superfamily protein
MRIAIDIDDVTVNIMSSLILYANEKYGYTQTMADHTFYDLSHVWKTSPADAMQTVYDFYYSVHMDTLPPIDGSVEAIKKIVENHSVAFVTSRPDFLQEKTQQWFNTYLPGVDLPIYFTNQYSPEGIKKTKKSTICKQIHAAMIIEDAPAYVRDCADANVKVLLFDQPWNRTIHEGAYIQRVNNWEQVTKVIASIID